MRGSGEDCSRIGRGQLGRTDIGRNGASMGLRKLLIDKRQVQVEAPITVIAQRTEIHFCICISHHLQEINCM